MQWLAAISVRRPVFATVIVLVFVVVGALGYTRLPVDRFPKVDFPTVSVVTRLDGATPKEVETEITDKIEEAVNTVSGIDELRSVSTEGISQVLVAFNLDKKVDVAAQEVRDRVNRILSDLPEDVDTPIVEKLDP
ncbi:MAG: efflux RND transporter permease subunit, partial [Verrucomicrobium sp.]|nr:efflux RND transporter permease subunit [Verrucomicrobium sp.]